MIESGSSCLAPPVMLGSGRLPLLWGLILSGFAGPGASARSIPCSAPHPAGRAVQLILPGLRGRRRRVAWATPLWVRAPPGEPAPALSWLGFAVLCPRRLIARAGQGYAEGPAAAGPLYLAAAAAHRTGHYRHMPAEADHRGPGCCPAKGPAKPCLYLDPQVGGSLAAMASC